MGVHRTFQLFSELIDQYESEGHSIQHLEVATVDDEAGVLDATLDVPLTLCSPAGERELSPEAAALTDDGGLQVDLSLPELPSTDEDAVSTTVEDVRVTDEGFSLTVRVTIDPTETVSTGPVDVDEGTVDDDPQSATAAAEEAEGSTDEESTISFAEQLERADPDDVSRQKTAAASGNTADEFAAVRDATVPPYEDTKYLQALYDSCDNFTEMSRHIQMDVSSETVRRYMIEADIHDPDTYDTSDEVSPAVDNETSSTDESAESAGEHEQQTTAAGTVSAQTDEPESVEQIPDEKLVTDGLGLPEDVHLEEVAGAVIDSVTVYEVTQTLGLNRDQTRAILEELNLLSLVLRPLADDPEWSVTYEQVVERIQEATH
ncbi:hypothetical protein ACFQH2_18190 [Natronoarchaeum sp. GCM10025703]|uniref:hypothetical protein n=1 Tax=unclassified Natronoarchaeum TaxID=2620183 RepID=UPI0036095B5A